MITYLSYLVDVFSNSRHSSGYQLFTQTCSFIRMRHISCWSFSRKMKRSKQIIYFHAPLYRLCLFTKYFRVWWLCWSHLFHWAWNRGYHRYSSICFTELEIEDTTDTGWSASRLDLHITIYSEDRLWTLAYEKFRRFQFSHCELSITM